MTQEEVAKRIGKSQPYISQTLKIIDLPQPILKQAAEKGVSKDHLLQLTKAENPEGLWQEILQGKTAKQIKKERERGKAGRGRPKNFTHTIQGSAFSVTVQFNTPEPKSVGEIIEALKDAVASLESIKCEQLTSLPPRGIFA